MNELDTIKGILFDLDGVLHVGSTVVEGAIDAVEELRRRGYRCRFITNTSTLSRKSLQVKLNTLGFHIEADEIISAVQAALLYVQSLDNPVCHLLLADDVKKDFEQFEQSDEKADFVIVGDIGDAWSYPLLNNVFKLLTDGAMLIAIHKNRFWQTEHGLQMDIGAFISALEYAAQTQAVIIGKPSPNFFHAALKDMGLSAEQTIIVGDDIDSDIGGGQAIGLTGFLVKTGKYRQDYVEASSVHPNYVIDTITELPQILPKRVQLETAG